MPHKDPEKRREYQRNYKRRQRVEGELSSPQKPVRKCYVCPEFPNMQAGGMKFRNGFLLTDDPMTQARIEALEGYGQYIFSWRAGP
jgi:hypothetical protein